MPPVDDVTTYFAMLAQQKNYVFDESQQLAIDALQRCWQDWKTYHYQPTRWWTRMVPDRLLSPPIVPQGVYLYGGVGRGKSMLMDGFFAAAPMKKKLRLHFHEFMRWVHRELDTLKGQSDPLDVLAKKIAKQHRLICFDEFHISDIADAMILYRLLDGLFRYGVGFVMTSNYAPDGLYPDGLHRDRLLPAIALLKKQLMVMCVDRGLDYRRRSLTQVATYYTPLNKVNRLALTNLFNQCATLADESPLLEVESRPLKAERRAGSVVWFDFTTLCATARSQNDYLVLAQRFQTIIVSDVPQMNVSMSAEARRFTWLVDIFYDQRVKLVLSAAVSPELLYVQGPMAHEFVRAVSRLIEMQSAEYLAQAKRLL